MRRSAVLFEALCTLCEFFTPANRRLILRRIRTLRAARLGSSAVDPQQETLYLFPWGCVEIMRRVEGWEGGGFFHDARPSGKYYMFWKHNAKHMRPGKLLLLPPAPLTPARIARANGARSEDHLAPHRGEAPCSLEHRHDRLSLHLLKKKRYIIWRLDMY